MRSPRSPQPRAQIVAPPGLAPVAEKLPESCTQEPKLPCREGLDPFSRCAVSVAPSPVCGERQGAGWGGSRVPRREPRSPTPSACLVPQGLSKKREAGRCFAGSGRGRHVGAGRARGLGPCGEGRAAREGRGGGRGYRGQPPSGMLALGPCWPSVRRVTLRDWPAGETHDPGGLAGVCWGLAARLRWRPCGGRGGVEECLGV